MRFGDLKTGDVMALAGSRAVLMARQIPHPVYPSFGLYVWYMLDEGRLSFDALRPDYELLPGSAVHSDGLITWTRIADSLARVNR